MPVGIYKHNPIPEEVRIKISQALKGRKKQPRTEEHKKNLGLANRGRKWPKDIVEKRVKHLRGRARPPFSPEWKAKISQTLKKLGIEPPHYKGEKCHFWRGGKSFEPYTLDWTRTLRQSIRERDKYICQICKEPQGDVALSVHHIDYNKENCNPDNLISLCKSCHAKTNFNTKLWIEYFTKRAFKKQNDENRSDKV